MELSDVSEILEDLGLNVSWIPAGPGLAVGYYRRPLDIIDAFGHSLRETGRH